MIFLKNNVAFKPREDLDQLIATISNQVSHELKDIHETCQKILEDYQSLETIEDGSGYPLRMIAWDRKCSS